MFFFFFPSEETFPWALSSVTVTAATSQHGRRSASTPLASLKARLNQANQSTENGKLKKKSQYLHSLSHCLFFIYCFFFFCLSVFPVSVLSPSFSRGLLFSCIPCLSPFSLLLHSSCPPNLCLLSIPASPPSVSCPVHSSLYSVLLLSSHLWFVLLFKVNVNKDALTALELI